MFLVIALVAFPMVLATSCGVFTTNTLFNSNVTSTDANDCIKINASGITINCNNYYIIKQNADGGTAIVSTQARDNVTVRNCNVIGENGTWWQGINSAFNSGQNWTVRDSYVRNATAELGLSNGTGLILPYYAGRVYNVIVEYNDYGIYNGGGCCGGCVFDNITSR